MRRVVVAAVALAGAMVGVAPLAVARAATLECGAMIRADTVLDGDIGPCSQTALIVNAPGVVLDLGGHRVFGTAEPRDGIGIAVLADGVTVQNGTVSNFDRGILVRGALNTVSGVTAIDNVGPVSGVGTRAAGEGIVVSFGDDNVVKGNVVRRNGPIAGVSVFAGHRNRIEGNVIEDNEARTFGVSVHGDAFGQHDAGIRIEGGVGGFPARNNVVTGNTLRRNGLHGIHLKALADSTLVANNAVSRNGVNPFPPGNDAAGIFVGSNGNVITGNSLVANTGSGIDVGYRAVRHPDGTQTLEGVDNRIERNVAFANGSGPSVAFDLFDGTPGCTTNQWSGNRFGTANAPCVARP